MIGTSRRFDCEIDEVAVGKRTSSGRGKKRDKEDASDPRR